MRIDSIVRALAALVSVCCFLLAAGLGAFAYRANEQRWHQGPTVIALSPGRGLHAMDLLLIGGAIAALLLGVVVAGIARR